MKILVIGSGAREHAIVWKIKQSPKVEQIFVAPGNAGTALSAQNVNIKATDIPALLGFTRSNGIALTMVGPEGPLAEGIVDQFEAAGMKIFGPSGKAAEIESSKVFSKGLMQKHGIPCAKSESFTSYTEAKAYLEKQKAPIVIKADGLAAGKGVVVAQSIPEALEALADFMGKKTLGTAGKSIIIEECLSGREVSVLAFTDGKTVIPMVAACDHKPVFDGNKGPNTGGMGAFSPPSFYTPALDNMIKRTVLEPTVKAMEKEGRPYKGVLYAGIMMTKDGPKTLEFNCRFGDPETQVIMPLLKTDLVDIMLATIEDRLDRMKIEWNGGACVGVVMASGGYPGNYKTGLPISGLDTVSEDITVFHAGTLLQNNEVQTSGGRVLTVTAAGKSIAEARQKVYDNISQVRFEGCHYRKDIGAEQ